MKDFWVFGYGSLMWNPGFAFSESHIAVLHGLHRRLCVYSWRHRGTRERPGLVLGLDRGGSCRGVAFRVEADRAGEVLAYLRHREMMGGVYRETWRPIRLDDGRDAEALAFSAIRAHPQYAPRMEDSSMVDLIHGAVGESGPNEDYVISTVEKMRDMGAPDLKMERLVTRLRDRMEQST